MNKRFDIELGVFLHELSKNTFDCDGFDSLDFRHREHIRNTVVNRIDNLLNMDNYFRSELDKILKSVDNIKL